MKVAFAIIVFSLLFSLPVNAIAEDTQAEACPEGKVMVTFADGNAVTIVCVDPGSEMDETVSNGSEVEDPSNYD